MDAPADAAAWRAKTKEAKESYADAWTPDFIVDAHDSLLLQAAPELASIHNGRKSIAHHKVEALYGMFVKPGTVAAITLESALAPAVFDKVEDHLRSQRD